MGHFDRVTCVLNLISAQVRPSRKKTNLRLFAKGQLISKANCQVVKSSKKRTNELVFTTMRRVFVHFLEIEDTKKRFQNLLTFNRYVREAKSLLFNYIYTVLPLLRI